MTQPARKPPRTEPREKPVPPAPDDLVERTCALDGCERTFTAHATAPLVWCSAAHRIRDPNDTRRKD